MACHARVLIEEMEEQRRNPVSAFVESIRNRRAAAKLAGRYGEAEVREVFSALAEVPDFAPARLLWNAGHRHVPLYCFVRSKVQPLFRVREMKVTRDEAWIEVEYQFGTTKPRRENFSLCRGWNGVLSVDVRRGL